MLLKAFSRIKRIKPFFHTREAIIDYTFNSDKGFGPFKEFPLDQVYSYYSEKQLNDGEVVALIFDPSPIDKDFFPAWLKIWASLGSDTRLLWLVSVKELEELLRRTKELMEKTDETTEHMLGRGWGGPRPNQKLHHFMPVPPK